MVYTQEDLNQLQLDILANDLSGNPLLTDIDGTPIHLLNDVPYIIPSINELFDINNNLTIGFQNFTDFYNSLIGDANTNATLKTDLQKIDSNLILSLLKMYKELHGENLDTPTPLPDGKTIAELLTSLNAISEQIFETVEVIGQYQIVGLNSDGKILILDSNTLDHAEKFVGIALESKTIGEQCKVKVFGEITNPSWTLEIGKTYFCGINGQISTNAMNNTWTQRIGKAKDIHTIIINAGDCILL